MRHDNRLAHLDQAMFDAMRAGNRAQLMQCLWIYEHPVDLDALQRFHHHLNGTFAGRLIERSPCRSAGTGGCRVAARSAPWSSSHLARATT